MKILYHHRTQGRNVEGVHIKSISDALRELGHTVKIVTLMASEVKEIKNETKGNYFFLVARIFARKAPEIVFESAEILYNLLVIIKLRKIIDEYKPALIYERYSLFLFATVWLAKRRNIKIILEVNDSALLPRVRKLFLRKISGTIESWIFCNCDGLIFVSTNFMSIAKEEYENMAPAVVSPNAANSKIFSPEKYNRREIRKKLGVEEKVVCGYVGAFIKWHGIYRFVEAVIPELKKNTSLVLLLIGDGDMYRGIKEMALSSCTSNQIILYGRVQHKEVAGLLSALDFAVLPDSNTYGSPMKIFEQMAMGLGVVAPSYGPIEEVIENNKTGWLFNPGDIKQCVSTVISVSKNKSQLKLIGENAKVYIKNNRQWKNNAQNIIGLYENMINK